MKARYFPLCDFANAEKGYRTSWSWASLIEARDIIFSRSSWQVGNGISIKIWKDKWLPPPMLELSPHPHWYPLEHPQWFTKLLIGTPSLGSSKISLPFISPDIIRQISLIPIGDGLENDRLIWPWNKSGIYTVKLGYHWHHSITIRSIPDNSHTFHRVNPMIWKIIWRLKTLPKIRSFLWRVLANAIPTFFNLYRRKIAVSPLCPVCHSFDETIEHLLLLCP